MSSGTYHIEKQTNPPQSILYLSGQDFGYFIRFINKDSFFSKDTLTLTPAVPTVALYAPLVIKYVRL